MADGSDDGQAVARAIWNVVLLSKDEHRSRGLIGKAARRKLVDRIVELMRIVRGR
jgi:hypothetical protein